MERVCFQLQVRPGRIEEYRARHARVWPDMLEALAAAGWHNYSLFLRPDGLLIGYFETPSLVDGDITGKEGDTFTAGDLGDFTVGKDATVLLGDPFVFDASNIDKFKF